MKTQSEGVGYIGDPDTVLNDDALSRDEKIARLTEWRDALAAQAYDKTINLESGEASRLISIERALQSITRD